MDTGDVIAAVGICASLVFAGVSSWQVARQLRRNGVVQTLQARDAWISRMHAILDRFVDEPELRRYFYEGASTEGLDAETARKVEAIAEMLADVLEYGLYYARVLHVPTDTVDWRAYPSHIVANSPALRRIVLSQPSWWETLAPRVVEWERANGGATRSKIPPGQARPSKTSPSA